MDRLIMTDLNSMSLFVSVVELGSLAAVARKIGISSAAVSKQLTKMEKDLGVQLLIRSTRRLELTEIGRSYYVQCQRVLDEAAEAHALISEMRSVPSGSLHVLSGRHFAASYIIPHVESFLAKYPKIHLNLELGERIPDLHNEKVDLVIGMSVSASGDIIQRKIGNTSYVYCASPKYLKSFGTPNQPKDLKKHRYITHSMRRPDDIVEFDDGKSIAVQPYIRVNDVQAMLEFALKGMGIVKLHRYVVQKHLDAGRLRELFIGENKREVPIYVAYQQRRFVPSKIRCFIDFFVAYTPVKTRG
jgi:DNA-binding transcriptional LysR family regulator